LIIFTWLNKNEDVFQSGGTVLNLGASATSTVTGVTSSAFVNYIDIYNS
jgi:hypothetical protein